MYGSNVASSHIYVRLGFLRKVFGIVTAQLALTAVVSAALMMSETASNYVKSSPWMMITSVLLTFVLIIALHFKSRETPTNFILLGLFTLSEAFMVGVAVTQYSVASVVTAFALTCAVTVALAAYTLQSKRDFSSWGAGLFSVLFILLLASLLQIVLQSTALDFALSCGGAALFSLFIVYDISMIMHRVSAEEYIQASISLYLDVINLFLHLLRIFGERKQ